MLSWRLSVSLKKGLSSIVVKVTTTVPGLSSAARIAIAS
jgi:hypothetical protein